MRTKKFLLNAGVAGLTVILLTTGSCKKDDQIMSDAGQSAFSHRSVQSTISSMPTWSTDGLEVPLPFQLFNPSFPVHIE